MAGRGDHSGMRSPTAFDPEAEFECFVAGLGESAVTAEQTKCGASSRSRSRTGPPPSITSEAVYDHALRVLDGDGLGSLTIRRLASDLKISTRTLYKRIGGHDQLIRNVVALHLSRLNPPIHHRDSWQTTLTDWCMNLHHQMIAHPHPTSLLTQHDHVRLSPRIQRLAEVVTRQGLSDDRAHDLCRWSTQVAFNAAIVAARSERGIASRSDSPIAGTAIVRDLQSTIEMILSGQYRDHDRSALAIEVQSRDPRPTSHKPAESVCT